VRRQLETAKEQVGKPFEKEQELAEKSARLAELDALLNMDESAGTALEGEGERPSFSAAESVSYGDGGKPGRAEARHRTDVRNPPQLTGRQEMSGCMEARVSVRERLAAIRERRAREQEQGKKPEPGKRRDRAAAL